MWYINEYLQLDYITKLQLLLIDGIPLANKKECNGLKTIFKLYDFYVEMSRPERYTTIRNICITEDSSILDNYLDDIDIDSIL